MVLGKSKKMLAALIAMVMLATVLTGCGGSKEAATSQEQAADKPMEKVRITLCTWAGYGPLFLARDKGFFKEEGVDVEISIVEGLAERKAAIKGNRVDAMATTLDIESTLQAEGMPMKVVWALDTSYGADGILAKKDIKTLADLKGHSVALDVGTTSHFFLLSCLQKAGLSDKDIVVTPMGSSGDAGQAFVAGKIDAAVTWEPWLGRGVKEGNGHLLIDSKEAPGLIVDAVAFRQDFAEQHPREVQAVVNALAKAMDYYANNQEDAVNIMAKGLNMDAKGFMDGIKLYNLEDNKNLYQGDLQNTLSSAAEFYHNLKVIENKPETKDMADVSYIEKIGK